MTFPIYLDFNATTPVDSEVFEALLPYLREQFGNPSSAHPYGREARFAVERARALLAALLDSDSGELLFTSGGTESNNMVVKGAVEARREHGNHLIVSAVEHPAILEPCAWLERRGFEITRLPVDEWGRVDPAAAERAITPRTILISVMLANNEVGVIQPVADLARIAHERGVWLHTDAAQAIGKIPVSVRDLGVDFLTVAGHKFYAPKGIGALFIRSGIHLPKFMHGAGHEDGRRAGTENVPYVVALGAAAECARRDLQRNRVHMAEMRNRLWDLLQAHLPGDLLRRNGDPTNSLPNTLSVSFRNVEANTLLARIGDRVAASAGAACHADSITVSPVLQAMRVPIEYAMGTIRFSVGKTTTAEEIDVAAGVVVEAVAALTS